MLFWHWGGGGGGLSENRDAYDIFSGIHLFWVNSEIRISRFERTGWMYVGFRVEGAGSQIPSAAVSKTKKQVAQTLHCIRRLRLCCFTEQGS